VSGEQIRATMRAVTRRMVQGAPYEEVRTALEAMAAMADADEVRREIAGRRLGLLCVYGPGDDEIERVLIDVKPVLQELPVRERARWLVGVCSRSPALAERHLRPLLAELRAAVARDPSDRDAERARSSVRSAIQGARERARRGSALPTPEPKPEPEPSTVVFPSHLEAGWDVVRYLVGGRRTYEEVTEALDALLELPDGEVMRGLVTTERLIQVNLHDRDDAEIERVIQAVMPELLTRSASDRASMISLACAKSRALTEKYVPPLIAELEEELRQRPDKVARKMLAGIKRNLERTRAGD
jgi:hypothetical protein